jgi:hypothetical protein
MYPVSERFIEALRGDHTVVSRADLFRGNQLLVSDLPVIGGFVVDDSAALIRRSCSISMPYEAAEYLPASPPSEGGLWPLGNEICWHSGIQFDDGSVEMVKLGKFRISKPRIARTEGDLSVVIDGFDRGRTVSRAKITVPYVIEEGTNYATAIKDLIKSRIPSLDDSDFSFMATDHTTPQVILPPDADPWEAAQEMAKSFGAELLWDVDVRCVLRPEPNPVYTPASFEYSSGEDATILGIQRDLDDEQAYNGVIVTGENTDLEAPVRAESWDTNPSSPTYYDPDRPEDSTYGPVPHFITSQLVTTEEQAKEAADATLFRVLGVLETIQFDAISNPAHSSGDVVRIVDEESQVTGVHILDNINIGVGDSFVMKGITRRRRSE